MTFITRQEITIRKGPLYFIAAVFMSFLLILHEQGKVNDGASIAAAIGLAIFGIIYYMLSKNKLVVDNDGLIHCLFFGKQKSMLWQDVKSSRLSWHFHGHGANIEWAIEPFSGRNISFQPSFYNRKNLRIIAEALVDKCPNAVIDQRIKKMAEGKFPWYIF